MATGNTVSSTGVTVMSPNATVAGELISGIWQLTAVTGPQSSASIFMTPSCMGLCTEPWFIGWDCAMTHGVAPATSHSEAIVASRPRAIGFSFRRNQCIMVYSLALEYDTVYRSRLKTVTLSPRGRGQPPQSGGGGGGGFTFREPLKIASHVGWVKPRQRR